MVRLSIKDFGIFFEVLLQFSRSFPINEGLYLVCNNLALHTYYIRVECGLIASNLELHALGHPLLARMEKLLALTEGLLAKQGF